VVRQEQAWAHGHLCLQTPIYVCALAHVHRKYVHKHSNTQGQKYTHTPGPRPPPAPPPAVPPPPSRPPAELLYLGRAKSYQSKQHALYRVEYCCEKHVRLECPIWDCHSVMPLAQCYLISFATHTHRTKSPPPVGVDHHVILHNYKAVLCHGKRW